MIKKIGFKNYKAFMQGEMEIKPLTFLVGANSVGKSSLIQLLLMLQQTCVEATPNDKSAFKLNGKNISLGENINLLKDKDKHNEFGLSFKLDRQSSRVLFRRTSDGFYSILQRIFMFAGAGLFSFDEVDEWKNKREKFLNFLSKARESNSGILSRLINADNVDKSYRELVFSYDFLHDVHFAFKNIETCELLFGFKYVGNSISKISAIELTSMTLSVNGKVLISLSLKGAGKNRQFSLMSFFYNEGKDFCNSDYNKQLSELMPKEGANLFLMFERVSLEFDMFVFSRNKKISIFLWVLLSFLNHSIKSLASCFDEQSINYVSPLRAYPKRYYFLDRSHVSSSLDTLDGDSITEILKEKPELRHQVNEWLKHFNLQIDVEAIEEIIHKLKVNQNGLELDITDVGFGISQVLPVIVQGFFAKKDSITVIEQPEVHLHPKMQADLGDLFIDIALPKNGEGQRKMQKSMLVETHSEYLLKRIRRRIAMGEIKSSDVAIYVVESAKAPRRSVIRKLDIDSTGTFEWPEEFYGGELLQDTIEYLKAQTKSKQ